MLAAWGAAKGSEADFSFPIHSVCPAPISFTAAFREVLLCCRDHLTVDPARRVDMGKARGEEFGSGPGKGGRAMAGGRDHSGGALLDEAVSPKGKKR
jgi:hypothetical protein